MHRLNCNSSSRKYDFIPELDATVKENSTKHGLVLLEAASREALKKKHFAFCTFILSSFNVSIHVGKTQRHAQNTVWGG
jgi:hypothetical protein